MLCEKKSFVHVLKFYFKMKYLVVFFAAFAFAAAKLPQNNPSLEAVRESNYTTACGGLLNGTEGRIEYYLGQRYYEYEKCLWTIRTPFRTRIRFDLIEAGLVRRQDNIQIHMIDSTGISQSYTFESNEPDFVILYGSVAVVLFHTDDYIDGRGFALSYTAEEEIDDTFVYYEDHNINAIENKTTLSFPTSGSYRDSELSTLAVMGINLDKGHYVDWHMDADIRFVQAEVGADGKCKDKIHIYQIINPEVESPVDPMLNHMRRYTPPEGMCVWTDIPGGIIRGYGILAILATDGNGTGTGLGLKTDFFGYITSSINTSKEVKILTMRYLLAILAAFAVVVSHAEKTIEDVDQETRCGATIEADSGTLVVPNSGQTIAPGSICIFTIHLQTTNTFRLNISNLDVSGNERDDDCSEAAVRIYSLTNLVPADKGENYTFCNDSPPPPGGSFYLSGNLATVIYQASQNASQNSGFTLNFDGIAFQPIQTTHESSYSSATSGLIRYPVEGEYETNRVNTWLIKTSDANPNLELDVILERIDMEECGSSGNFSANEACLCDALIIYDITNTGVLEERARLCGRTEEDLVLERLRPNFIVAFFTDHIQIPGQGTGFQILYKPHISTTTTQPPTTTTERPPPSNFSSSCGGVLEGIEGVIEYKLNQTYQSYERCLWTIRTPFRSSIRFDLLAGGYEKNYDNVQIHSIDASGIKHMDPEAVPNFVEMDTTVAVVLFQSDYSNLGFGFKLKFTAGSDNDDNNLYYDDQSIIVEGEITANLPETGFYRNLELSTLSVMGQNIYSSDWYMNTTVTSVDLDVGTDGECNDVLHIYQIIDPTSNRPHYNHLRRYTPYSGICQSTDIPSETIMGYGVLAILASDIRDNSKTGLLKHKILKMKYLAVFIAALAFAAAKPHQTLPNFEAPRESNYTTECGGVLNGTQGLIEYKLHERYAEYEKCLWTIRTPFRTRIRFDLIEAGFERRYDNIQVHMIDSTGISQSYTFQETDPEFVILYGSVAVVLFNSNDYVNRDGFALSFTAEEEIDDTFSYYEDLSVTAIENKTTLKFPASGSYRESELSTFTVMGANRKPGQYLDWAIDVDIRSVQLEVGTDGQCRDKIHIYQIINPEVASPVDPMLNHMRRYTPPEGMCQWTDISGELIRGYGILAILTTDESGTGSGLGLDAWQLPTE
ncbi:CUB domain-containing protein 2 [Orchesella cincta]|uniref:CUB domain-containing protein 2 n=1 Tax=Orchesella cincta TaxID=48709 RepID=A0A1D2MXE4_ORCCI|nr:CUB domain-containing protein 2 [Orchesella cincta]